jgi:hypothetical protein
VDVAIESVQKREAPALRFSDYALAFHFAAEWNIHRLSAASRDDVGESAGRGTVPEPMESYERDLLLYAHRDESPFRTHVVSVPPHMATLTAYFPAELAFESELRRIRLRCEPEGQNRRFTVSASVTIFKRSRILVLNLVLLPPGGPDDEANLNEYDVIKLIKLWEGGEGRTAADWNREILFESGDQKSKTLDETADEVFRDWLSPANWEAGRAAGSHLRVRRLRDDLVQPAPPLAYRVGTVELYVPDTEWRDQLFRDIAVLNDARKAPDRETDRSGWDRVVAVGGILQGLLDFDAISSDELADVFAHVDVDADSASLTGFHKGTLLSLSAESDAGEDERPSPIGVDPYLALPNVVLLHNEQRLKAARRLELRLSEGQPRRSGTRGDRVNIDQTANGLDAITGLLAQHLPNIFHYENERRLYEEGGHSRGFDDLETLIRFRREDLMSTLQRRERRRDKWTAVLAIVSAILVGVVVAVQNLVVEHAVEALDWWVLLIVAGFLYLGFFQLRNRLF